MKIFFALFLTLNCFFLFAQPGKVDTTFNEFLYNHFGSGNGFSSNQVNCVYEQPDGRLIVGGQFTAFNGIERIGLVRLNSDGSLDSTFDAGTTFQNLWEFKDIVLQPDGKIILARITGTGSLNLRRLNSDGSLDSTALVLGNLSQGVIEKMLIQPDGKLILCGNFLFQDANMTNYFHLVRFNTDGSVDHTFTTGAGFDFPGTCVISKMELDNQGKLMIAGNFNGYNGINSRGIIRINSDGTVDPTFTSGIGFGYSVSSMVIQPDQKIIIGGDFSYYQTFTMAYGIIRLNSDGNPDTTFHCSEIFTAVDHLNVMPDSSIIFRADNSGFPSFNNALVRLNSNGSLDTMTTGYDAIGPSSNNFFTQIDLLMSGKLIVIGQFEFFSERYKGGIARIDESFVLDNSFNPKPGFKGEIQNVIVQPGGKIYAAKAIGNESEVNVYNDVIVKGLIRLNNDGTLDTTFHIHDSLLVSAEAIVRQPDGKIVVGGMTKIYDGSNWSTNKNIARFNQDGSLDQSFIMFPFVANTLNKLLLQPDGKIIILGAFSLDNGNTYPCIARLNSDGTLDNSFNVGSGANNIVTSGVVTSSGKIIVGGDFTSYNGIPVERLAAVNPDGSLDPTFAFNGHVLSFVKAIEKQADGKLYLTAESLSDNNNISADILRLNPDGSIDNSFDAYAFGSFSGGNVIHALLPLPDGKLMVGGNFYDFENTGASGIVRVNADGSRDNTFYSVYIVSEPNILVSSISLGLGGKIVIGGNFSKVAGTPANNIAVLQNDLGNNFEVSFHNVSNVSCTDTGSVTAVASGGFPPYQYLWSNAGNPSDSSQIISAQGIYTCSVTDSIGTVSSASLLINGPASSNGFDLKANLNAGPFRTGFDNMLVLTALNDGCIPASGQLIFVMDTIVHFNSAIPAPSYQSNDTLIWDFSNLSYDSGYLMPLINCTVSTAAQIGDTVLINLLITPVSGDTDTLNNRRNYAFPIINGYDPNIKSVYPVGKCDEAYIENGQKLTYTVQFQNTGNAEAINIVVVDVLNENLDLHTLHIVGNSHSVWVEVAENNTVKFHFDEINLPDSNSNEAASHGYVVFEIDPISNTLAHNTVISNKAEIYFDFNPAIVTNTCSNTIYDGNLDEIECDPGGNLAVKELSEENSFNFFPNPTNNRMTIIANSKQEEMMQVVITDLSGKEVYIATKDPDKDLELDLASLETGTYILIIRGFSGELAKSSRIVKI